MVLRLLIGCFLIVSLSAQGQVSSVQPAGSAGTATHIAVPGADHNFEVKIFPNPVTDKRITIELSRHQISEIRLSNITGRVVYIKRLQTPIGRYQILLDDLPSGIYLLRIIANNNQVKTSRVLVQSR